MEVFMGNEKLLQYIASLSEEERATYRDLIEETLQRDRVLEETFSKTKLYIETFSENLRRVLEESLHLQSSLSLLNERLLEVKDASEIISKVVSQGPVWN